MTITFLDRFASGQNVSVECPKCNTRHGLDYEENKRRRTVCSRCRRTFSVQIFTDGMLLVE